MKENNNKRTDNRNSRPNNNQRNSQNKNPSNLLPSPRILESYENIAPGSVNKMLEMVEKEQKHRHLWQDKYLKFHNLSYKAGLIFGFIYNIALLFLITNLIKQGNEKLALKLFVVNATLIAFTIIVTSIERKIITRKPPRRNFGSKDRQLNNDSRKNFNNSKNAKSQ